MSAKRDRIHNEMVIPFYHDEAISTNVYTSTAYDTRLGRSYPTNMLLILVMKTWAAGGTMIVRCQHCNTQAGTYTTFKSFANARQTTGCSVFIGQANFFRRWIRLVVYNTGGVGGLTAIGVLARGKREPVTQQSGTCTLSDGSSHSSSSSSESSSSSHSSSSSESSSSSQSSSSSESSSSSSSS